MQESQILVAQQDGLAFVQIKGRASFQNAGSVKSFYGELLEKGILRFVFDLEDCTYLDSTFLGTLAGLGAKLRRHEPSGELHILNVSERNLELMENLGLDRVLSIKVAAKDFHKPEAQELASSPTDKKTTGEHMLEAHEELVKLDPANAPKFKDVIAYLKEDLGKSQGD